MSLTLYCMCYFGVNCRGFTVYQALLMSKLFPSDLKKTESGKRKHSQGTYSSSNSVNCPSSGGRCPEKLFVPKALQLLKDNDHYSTSK